MPEMCLWPAKTRKNFLRCIYVFDLVLKYCSDIYEGIGIQLLFYFVILVNIVASFIKWSFFICGLLF